MTEENDFAKLLRDAPMAPDADTVTLVGALERTADPKQFGLRLPDGRSVTLDADAVKSAKRIAGAIGQLLVQLELDAKRVPEGLRNDAPYVPKAPAADFNIKILTDPVKVVGDPLNGNTVAEGIGFGGLGGDPALFAPFAALMPHQASNRAITALSLDPRIVYRTESHWPPSSDIIHKVQLDNPHLV